METKQKPSNREERKHLALATLHWEIDLHVLQLMEFAQAGRKVLLVRSGDPLYERILRALRKFVKVGGKPFEDDKFSDFFRKIVNVANSPAQQIPSNLRPLIRESEKLRKVRYEDPKYQAEQFVKTVVRVCGGKWGPDGKVTLIDLSKSR